MTRVRKVNASSLELLLDIICNTFGGVVFLAILVAVSLRTTTRLKNDAADNRETEIALLEIRKTHEETLAKLDSLRKAADMQETVALQFVSPESEELVRRWNKLTALRDDLELRCANVKEEVARYEGKTTSAAEESQSLQQEFAATQKELKEARDHLRAQRAARTRAAALPRLRKTNKREIGLIVRYSRLYVWHRYDADGFRGGLNTDDFVVVEETEKHYKTRPKPYAGVVLSENTRPTEIARKFSRFDNQQFYLAVAVWEDSFPAFQILKNEMIRLGYEYRLIPVRLGDPLTDKGGAGSQVQ